MHRSIDMFKIYINFLYFSILDYKGAVKDFTLVSGHIPLPPRYTFGVFYSRYWAYNDQGEMVSVHIMCYSQVYNELIGCC